MAEKQNILNFVALQREIENNPIKPIYLIYGEESYLHKITLDKFKIRFAEDKKSVNYENFFGEDLDFNRLANSLHTLPLGVSSQCVIIRELDRIKAPSLQRLNSIIDELSFSDDNLIVLLFSNSKQIPQNINTKKILKYGEIVSLSKPGVTQTRQWIEEKCRKADKEIDEEAIYYLQRITENDFALICNELEKLFTFLGDSIPKINKEILMKNIYGLSEGNIFDFVDAVGERKTGKALSLLKKIMESGEYHPLQILAMLNRQIRLILKIKIPAGNSKQNKGGKNLPYFVVKRLMSQSQKYKMDEFERIFNYLLSAEINLKTSSLLPSIVLEQLVVKITK